MALKRITKSDPNISMSSMTDIVFLLLIFFLVTSTLVNPNALKLLLPKSSNQTGEKATTCVSIHDRSLDDAWDGEGSQYAYYVNTEEVAFGEIEPGIIELIGGDEDPLFSINSDESVPIGEVVQVMNIAKRNHFKVILATAAEQ